jgi:ribosomal protein S18 acetylase RimI-like enzyme
MEPHTPRDVAGNQQAMTPDAQIRLLTPADAAAYWHIRQQALEFEPDAFSSSAEDHRATTVEETAARIGSDPANNFIVGAFLDSELVGTAGLYRESGLKTSHKAHVWGVYVTVRARGAGVGRLLMNALLERATSIGGIEQIALSVTTTKVAALKLYQSLGFESFGCERNALKIGDRYYDTEHMVLHLSHPPATP